MCYSSDCQVCSHSCIPSDLLHLFGWKVEVHGVQISFFVLWVRVPDTLLVEYIRSLIPLAGLLSFSSVP